MVVNHVKKAISLVLTAAILVASLAACGSGAQTAEQTTGAATAATTAATTAAPGPVSIRFASYGDWAYSKSIEAIFLKKVKDDFNIDLILEAIAKTDYDEKVNVMWAAGDIPDVIELMDLKKEREGVENKVFIPLTDMIKSHPDWQGVDLKMLKNATYDNEIYGVNYGKNVPYVIYYRPDWMKNLGMSIPTTVDELYQMMYAFTKNDPDKNGKDDTTGFTLRGDYADWWPIWALFLPTEGPGIYLDESDHTFKDSVYLAEDMKTALAWFNKAYKDGVLDREWVVDNKSTCEDKFITGKVGIWTKQPQWILPRYTKMKEANPKAEMMTLPAIKGKYGYNYRATTEATSFTFLTKNCKDIEKGKQLMGYLFSSEGVAQRALGFEGQTYKVENGQIVWADEEVQALYNPGNFYASIIPLKLPTPEPLLEEAMKCLDNVIYNEGYGYVITQSEAFNTKYADMLKLFNEYLAKIIIGELPVSAYDEMLTQYKSMGGDQILEEVNRLLKEQK